MSTKIPTNLIASLSHSKSWDEKRRLTMMVKLLQAFPEKFDELTENINWEPFLPLIARDKKERETKYKQHAIFKFFAEQWNENYREYVFDVHGRRIINLMTRQREVRLAHIRPQPIHTINGFIWAILTQECLNRKINHMISTALLTVVRVCDPLGIFVNVYDMDHVRNDHKFIHITETEGDLGTVFAELKQLRGLEISHIDLYQQMFIAKAQEVYYLYDQRMTNNNTIHTILEPIKIPYFGTEAHRIPEDPVNIIPTDFIGDESDAPAGFSVFTIDTQLGYGMVLSKIYKVETATRQVYCIIGYFGEHKRVVFVPKNLTDFYFGTSDETNQN